MTAAFLHNALTWFNAGDYPVNIVASRKNNFGNFQYLQIKEENISESAILSVNNLFKCLHPVHQQESLISVKLRGLLCSKKKKCLFSNSRNIVNFFNRKMF